MPNYRRAFLPGGTFFFTVVTFRRRKFFERPEYRLVLRETIERVRRKHPFSIDAWVLLPEHMHCIWTLPEGDSNYSGRWGMIKSGFSMRTKKKSSQPRMDKCIQTETPGNHYLAEAVLGASDKG